VKFRIGIDKEMQIRSKVFDQGLRNTDEYRAFIERWVNEDCVAKYNFREEHDPAAYRTWYSGELPDWPESTAFITLLQSIARGYR
jgi:hypothetical protein